MDSLFDLLSKRDFDAPPEVEAIKNYIRAELDSEVEVRLRGEKTIIICAPSASLIATLRLRQTQLKRAAKTDRSLVFRVG